MTEPESSHEGQASDGANHEFERLAEPLRREIKLHCYRMLGSIDEAEDLVQETYLRAWRSFDSFAGGSFRAWLYRIATNACLNAIASRKSMQRWLPDQHGPAAVETTVGGPATDMAWLEPYPDADLEGIADRAPNPEARYTSREAVQLAFVASIQQLAPRQRAALLLCDVLGWAATEAATLLGGSTASINSALQRARATLGKSSPDRLPPMPEPNPAQQQLLGRYLQAWEGRDLDGFVALLKEDATYTMPPWRQWFAGREAIRSFFAMAWKGWTGFRMLPTAANGQPAFALYAYRIGADETPAAHSIHVLALEHDLISRLTLFVQYADPHLFRAFGLPRILPGAGSRN
jgi:RNA polymerase sigma-70 factor (ECF subfamily)